VNTPMDCDVEKLVIRASRMFESKAGSERHE
jgi:hypothetical protein